MNYNNEEGTAAKLYEQLKSKRKPYIDRARKCCALTIPSLMPESSFNETQAFESLYQNVGARCLTNLSAKLVLTLFPPNNPNFRMMPTSAEFTQMEPDARAEIQAGLSKYERIVANEIESSNDRPVINYGMKLLKATGNVLFIDTVDSGMRALPLNQYVVRRDPSGTVLDIVTEEKIAIDILPENIQKLIVSHERAESEQENKDKDDENTETLYTHFYRDGKNWKIYQEVCGMRVPDSDGSFPLDSPSFIVLARERVPGEHYGRGMVEEYYGDLVSLNELEKSIVQGAVTAARMLIQVSPNGTTRKKDLESASNGAIITGEEGDVNIIKADKNNDFSTAQAEINKLEKRLEMAFLLNTSIQRDGERVTAEEIRYMAQELETSFGGLYSSLTNEFLRPYINRKIKKLEKKKALPSLPKDSVDMVIITGLDALGRGSDYEKLQSAIRDVVGLFGPEPLAGEMNFQGYINKVLDYKGADKDGLFKSEEQKAQEQQQAQQQQLIQTLGPNAINQIGGLAQKTMENGNVPGQQTQGAA